MVGSPNHPSPKKLNLAIIGVWCLSVTSRAPHWRPERPWCSKWRLHVSGLQILVICKFDVRMDEEQDSNDTECICSDLQHDDYSPAYAWYLWPLFCILFCRKWCSSHASAGIIKWNPLIFPPSMSPSKFKGREGSRWKPKIRLFSKPSTLPTLGPPTVTWICTNYCRDLYTQAYVHTHIYATICTSSNQLFKSQCISSLQFRHSYRNHTAANFKIS